jgi:hypothetical protein
MEKSLISYEEYEFFRNSGRPYSGYVWTKEGNIYEVKENYVTMVKPKPVWPYKSLGDSHRTVFFDVIKHPQISLLHLGSDDVLYDMNGNFVSVIEATDPVKGEIKILKSYVNFNAPLSWSEEQRKEYEIVDLKDVTLSAEAYSRLFTHILSFTMKDKLEKVRNKKVAVESWRKDKPEFFAIDSEESDPESLARFNSIKRYLAAVITNADDSQNTYQTIWNVINILGAHELLGHGETGWWDNNHYTHHLPYLFQMGHPTWKNTTPEFKEIMEKNLSDYYRDYSKYEYDYRKGISRPYNYEKSFNDLRSMGLYPKWNEKNSSLNVSKEFNDRLSRELQKKINMKNPFKE